MKRLTAFILSLALACSVAACGCQSNNLADNTTATTGTTPTIPTTQPILDPTILDPTFETNIPDSTVNDNSTMPTDTTGNTENTMPRHLPK